MALGWNVSLSSRLTLTGLLPLASPSVLHHFACDCADKALEVQRLSGYTIDPALQEALSEKRRWIEGDSNLGSLKDAMRGALDITLRCLQDSDAIAAWASLSVVEAVFWEPKEAALQAASRALRSILMRKLRLDASHEAPQAPSSVASASSVEAAASEAAGQGVMEAAASEAAGQDVMEAAPQAPSSVALASSVEAAASEAAGQEEAADTDLGLAGALEAKAAALQIPPLLFRLWVQERFWQEDRLTERIQEEAWQRRGLLGLLESRKAVLSSEEVVWQAALEERLF